MKSSFRQVRKLHLLLFLANNSTKIPFNACGFFFAGIIIFNFLAGGDKAFNLTPIHVCYSLIDSISQSCQTSSQPISHGSDEPVNTSTLSTVHSFSQIRDLRSNHQLRPQIDVRCSSSRVKVLRS